MLLLTAAGMREAAGMYSRRSVGGAPAARPASTFTPRGGQPQFAPPGRKAQTPLTPRDRRAAQPPPGVELARADPMARVHPDPVVHLPAKEVHCVHTCVSKPHELPNSPVEPVMLMLSKICDVTVDYILLI